jgi:hypothetical protein
MLVIIHISIKILFQLIQGGWENKSEMQYLCQSLNNFEDNLKSEHELGDLRDGV